MTKTRILAKIWTFWVIGAFLDDVSMMSSGGVGYGRVTWRPVSGPRGWGTWRTAQGDGGSGADVTLRWR